MKLSYFYPIGFIILFISLGFWATIGIACIFVPLALEVDTLIMSRKR